MAQADQTVQNNTFPTVRADINNNLAALFSKNSGATAPSTTVAYMDWIDTSGANPVWKKRNAANNAWITLGTIVGNTITFEGTLPSQSGNSGKYLTTDGTNASWGAISLSVDVQEFTSNGTWTKPGAGTVALIRCWGGGGSGGRNVSSNVGAGGGGGGACVERWMKLSDLGATESVTIGAGGAGKTADGVGNAGGTTTFGSHVSAYGGGGGGIRTGLGNAGGGGGGGSLGAGGTADTAGNDGAGGNGHSANTTGATASASGEWGGGAGGGGASAGGNAFWGGAGGGNRTSTTSFAGGVSINGGDGSDANTGDPGGFPGGGSGGYGGGNTGAGGAGYCIVIVY